jgi:hypothetical protein
MASAEKYLVNLKKSSKWIIYSLIAEFVLGMLVNLFALTPDDPGYAAESIFIKLFFPLHGIVGLILVVLSIAIFYFAVNLGKESIKKFAMYGLISVLVAAGAGLATIILKDNASEIGSFVMSVGFIAALVSYGKLFLLLRE